MARIRTIKPEFWTDAALIECSLNARLLFIGTWNFADDEGNLDRSAKQIKARIFPADSVECEPLIQELIDHGLLNEYSVNGKNYLNIDGFKKHQVINRPGKPQCPIYEESVNTHGTFTEPSLPEGKGREGKGENIVRLAPDVAGSTERRTAREAAERSIAYLNEKAGTHYRATEANLKFAVDRMIVDKASEDDLRAVVDMKCREASEGKFERKYLRPETLWNATKFGGYIGQVGASLPAAERRVAI